MSAQEKKEVKKGCNVPSQCKLTCVEATSHQAQAMQSPCSSSQESSASLDSHSLTTSKKDKKNYKGKNRFHDNIQSRTMDKGRERNDSFDQTLADAEIDILYAQYLQAKFLESQSQRKVVLRSESALEKLQKLCSLTSIYLSQVKSEEFKLQIVTALVKTQEHLQKQEDILKPVFEVIPTLKQRYESLAEAVNAVSHKLVVKDVLLPEPGQEGEIVKIQQEMLEFISQFFEEYPCYREVVPMVEALKSCCDAGRQMTDGLQRGFEFLVEARDLYFTEASLALSSVGWQPETDELDF